MYSALICVAVLEMGFIGLQAIVRTVPSPEDSALFWMGVVALWPMLRLARDWRPRSSAAAGLVGHAAWVAFAAMFFPVGFCATPLVSFLMIQAGFIALNALMVGLAWVVNPTDAGRPQPDAAAATVSAP